MNDAVRKAYRIAKETRERSYSPFSNFKVGAAVIFGGCEEIFGGCNVENSSYGGTICAERSAILAGISSLGRQDIAGVVVVTDAETLTVPCAICLQFIAEFATPESRIYLGDMEGIKEEYLFSQLLPKPFVF